MAKGAWLAASEVDSLTDRDFDLVTRVETADSWEAGMFLLLLLLLVERTDPVSELWPAGIVKDDTSVFSIFSTVLVSFLDMGTVSIFLFLATGVVFVSESDSVEL